MVHLSKYQGIALVHFILSSRTSGQNLLSLSTSAPSSLPRNSTFAPSESPMTHNNTFTPTRSNSFISSTEPTHHRTNHPTSQPTATTEKPTQRRPVTAKPIFPTTTSPTIAPTHTIPPKHAVSIWAMLLKLIGWLVLIALSGVLFGMCMSYRYHTYYFLLQTWYQIRRLQWWRRLKRFFGWNNARSDSSLNEVLFEQGDPLEGLLLRERES